MVVSRVTPGFVVAACVALLLLSLPALAQGAPASAGVSVTTILAVVSMVLAAGSTAYWQFSTRARSLEDQALARLSGQVEALAAQAAADRRDVVTHGELDRRDRVILGRLETLEGAQQRLADRLELVGAEVHSTRLLLERLAASLGS